MFYINESTYTYVCMYNWNIYRQLNILHVQKHSQPTLGWFLNISSFQVDAFTYNSSRRFNLKVHSLWHLLNFNALWFMMMQIGHQIWKLYLSILSFITLLVELNCNLSAFLKYQYIMILYSEVLYWKQKNLRAHSLLFISPCVEKVRLNTGPGTMKSYTCSKIPISPRNRSSAAHYYLLYAL